MLTGIADHKSAPREAMEHAHRQAYGRQRSGRVRERRRRGALRCAVLVQQGMVEREAEVPEDQRIRFRTGINLGDVIQSRDRLSAAPRKRCVGPTGALSYERGTGYSGARSAATPEELVQKIQQALAALERAS